MTPRPDLEPGLVLAGRYHLRQPLGEGGAGTVWQADDEVLDRAVAVKLLHPELERDTAAVARFRREATAAAALTHPNAVIVYDIGEDAGRVFLVMELVEGPTLGDLLAPGPLPAADVAAIAVAVGRALGAAHARGLVHRDVKPGNVLVDRDGVAKVADFGIATALGDAQARLTKPGMVVGTSTYLAPEQLEDQPLDARADVYSLGLVLHECCSGRPAFAGGTAVEIASRRLAGDVPPPSRAVGSLPAGLDEAIARATRRDPADRFADGAALAAAVAPLLDEDATARLARQVEARLGPPSDPAASPAGDPTHPTRPDVRTPAPAPATPVAAADANGERPATATLTAAADEDATTVTPARPATRDGAGGAPDDGDGGAPQHRAPIHRWPRLLVAVAALLVVGVGGVVLADLGGEEEPGAPRPDPAQAADTGQLEIADAADFDPFGDDGGEHGEDVPNAYDGDTGTNWHTQRYYDPLARIGKPGVGFWLDVGEATTVREITLSLAPAGADLTVYAGDGPPPADTGEGWSPADWGREVASVSGADREQQLELDDGEGRVFLLWFTALPQESGGNHRVEVADVVLRG